MRAADVDFEEVIRKFGRERFVRYWAQIFVKMEKIMIAHNQEHNMNTEKLTAGCATGFMVVVDGRDYLLRHILSIKCKYLFACCTLLCPLEFMTMNVIVCLNAEFDP